MTVQLASSFPNQSQNQGEITPVPAQTHTDEA